VSWAAPAVVSGRRALACFLGSVNRVARVARHGLTPDMGQRLASQRGPSKGKKRPREHEANCSHGNRSQQVRRPPVLGIFNREALEVARSVLVREFGDHGVSSNASGEGSDNKTRP
jgi:hypothetical protein